MVFHLTRAEFDAKKEELRQLGVNITTDTGYCCTKVSSWTTNISNPLGF